MYVKNKNYEMCARNQQNLNKFLIGNKLIKFSVGEPEP